MIGQKSGVRLRSLPPFSERALPRASRKGGLGLRSPTAIRRWVSAVLLAVLWPLFAGAQSGERIRDYTIEVDVRTDGSLDVTEQITVHAEQQQIRRGIYRDFPTRYRDRYGNDVVVELEVQEVLRDGAAEPWFTEQVANGVRINTGNDDFLPRFPADYRFTLRYRTTRQLGFFDDHDELYWNAIGTGWVFPIDRGSVVVRLPGAVPAASLEVEGYTGPQGAQGQAYMARADEPGVARYALTEPLDPYEGFTIVLSFPKGIVAAPTAADRARWLVQDNRGVLVALGGFALLLAFMAYRWNRVGRDPRAGVIIPRYQPPAGRSPAELRYLKRSGGYDMRCFTADLLTSAVQGRVKIEREDRRLFADRWHLRRGSNADRTSAAEHDAVTPGDRDGAAPDGAGATFPTVTTLVGGLFKGGGDNLELHKKNAARLSSARSSHQAALRRRLHGSHFRPNAASSALSFAIAIATAYVAFQVADGAGVPIIIGLCALMAIAQLVFMRLVQAPTVQGRRLLDEIEGLKLYLGVAERDELAAMGGPGSAAPPLDAGRYEMLLPYAVALDVEEAWTRKFTAAVGAAAAAEAARRIGWYRGADANDLGGIAKAVGSSLSSTIASSASPPGSSSGRGGGGSSGGGGGGGGGGGR